ncbi:hypothetical protein A6R68_23426 [Neotoma lepida]|uniref:Uncharacterized protein n=1 Tax=Neotoma lepida TaxID=56216 RepID=A0A1A6HX55_NEOLE|nr:hypothetical protein A6R68_23426 [Neotoma lepida]
MISDHLSPARRGQMPKPFRVLEPMLPPAEREQPSPLHKENWPPGLVPASARKMKSPPEKRKVLDYASRSMERAALLLDSGNCAQVPVI